MMFGQGIIRVVAKHVFSQSGNLNFGNFVIHKRGITESEVSNADTASAIHRCSPSTSQARPGHSRCPPPPRIAGRGGSRARLHERPTLRRIEAGNHGVGMGIYAAVLQALGLLDGLTEVADPSNDAVGLSLSSEALPERVRLRRRKVKKDVV
jgi:hypothetical protein